MLRTRRTSFARLLLAGGILMTVGMAGARGTHRLDSAPIPIFDATEIRRYDAPGAFQGVAVGPHAFYAIADRAIVKYDKTSGRRLAAWSDRTGRIVHLNSCTVAEALLICAHSNFPRAPETGSIETFDAATLTPRSNRNLGQTPGSLTWIDRHAGLWWLCFARYGAFDGTAGHGNAATTIVAYDAAWHEQRRLTLPPTVLRAFGTMSASGGAWDPDGHLTVSGHDRGELYVLTLPKSGTMLRHIATIRVPGHGQAFAWDPASPRTVYTIDRATHTVLVAWVPVMRR